MKSQFLPEEIGSPQVRQRGYSIRPLRLRAAREGEPRLLVRADQRRRWWRTGTVYATGAPVTILKDRCRRTRRRRAVYLEVDVRLLVEAGVQCKL